jgi:threonine dehydratase
VISIEDIRSAAAQLEGVAHRTPVVTSRMLDERAGATVLMKAENLQRGGAFKFRGAYNKVSRLSEDELRRGVFAASSGNHAQAVAIAAGLFGSTAVILMPQDAPASKLEATRGYGAEVITYDRYAEDRDGLAAGIAHERGLTMVPAFDDPLVMAGQGTAALELIEDAGPIDILVAPMSGGGLMAGCATAATAMAPGVRVIGVEPETADDTRRSLEAGERVGGEVPHTIADGLQVAIPGELTFEVNRRLVERVVTVTDDELIAAMAFLFERTKQVVEPSGAAGVAALLGGRVADLEGARVGVILSGGNVSAARFGELVGSRGARAGPSPG